MRTFFKKVRFFLRFLAAFFKKRSRIIFFGIFLGILFYQVLPFILKLVPSPRKVEKIGIVGKYSVSEIPPEIYSKISFGLTTITPEGTVSPALADRWEVSLDGKIFTFYFGKKRYFWHDGSEFKLEDINYNFKDARILPVGSNILKIILNEPFSPLPSVVSQPLFKRGLIGLGGYKVKKMERSGQILKSIYLTPVERKSKLPFLIYRFYVNESQLRTAFRLGEVTKINELEFLGEFTHLKNITVSRYQDSGRYAALFFNISKEPFGEKSLRQAIAYAVEKPSDKRRAFSPLNSSSWALNPGVKKYEKDKSKAKLLISKIKLDQKSPIILYFFPSLEEEAKKIKSELDSIGVNIEVKITHFLPEDFDLLLAVQRIPTDPDQYSLWHTGQPANLTHFSNPRIDKLLEDGRKVFNLEERRKIYFDFQRFLVEESPAVFLYYPSYYTIERK